MQILAKTHLSWVNLGQESQKSGEIFAARARFGSFSGDSRRNLGRFWRQNRENYLTGALPWELNFFTQD